MTGSAKALIATVAGLGLAAGLGLGGVTALASPAAGPSGQISTLAGGIGGPDPGRLVALESCAKYQLHLD